MKEQPAATSTAREPINLTDASPAAIFFVDYFGGAFIYKVESASLGRSSLDLVIKLSAS